MKKVVFVFALFLSAMSFATNTNDLCLIVDEKNETTFELSADNATINVIINDSLSINDPDETTYVVSCYANIYYNGELVGTVTSSGVGFSELSAIASCYGSARRKANTFIQAYEGN